MKTKKHVFFAALLLCLTAVCGRVEAKELIFHMGYGLVQVIDGDTDAIVADIPVEGWVREMAFSADKKTIYVATKRHLIHTIDVKTMKVVNSVDLSREGWDRFIYGITLAADGKTAYVNTLSRHTAGGDVVIGTPAICQIELRTGKILRTVEVPWGVGNIALVQGGKMLYAVGLDLYKIDVSGKTMKIVETYPMFDRGMNILPLWTYTEENGGVFLSNYYNAEGMGLFSFDLKNGKIEETMIKGEAIFAYNAIYSPDKSKAYALMDEVNIIDLKTRTVTDIVPVHEGTCYGVIPTADGSKLFVGGGGSTVTVFDARTMRVLKVMQMETDGWAMRKLTL